MSEMIPQPSPEAEFRPIIDVDATVTGQELADYYKKLADEFDLEEHELMVRLEENPSLVNDDAVFVEWIGLKEKKKLLERFGKDFSEHTLNQDVDSFLKQMFGENEGTEIEE